MDLCVKSSNAAGVRKRLTLNNNCFCFVWKCIVNRKPSDQQVILPSQCKDEYHQTFTFCNKPEVSKNVIQFSESSPLSCIEGIICLILLYAIQQVSHPFHHPWSAIMYNSVYYELWRRQHPTVCMTCVIRYFWWLLWNIFVSFPI